MTMGAPERRLTAAVLAMWAPFLVYGLWAGDEGLVRFFPDDAFYYLQPASTLAATGRATFDGVHVTNGFQPLNFLLVTALAAVGGKARLLPAVFLAHTCIVWAAPWWLARRWLPRHAVKTAVIAIGTTTLPPVTVFLWLSVGMEAAVLVVAVVALSVAWSVDGPAQAWWRGAAISLVVLARLDAAIAMVPFALASLQSVARTPGDMRPAAARSALVTWGVPALAIAVYALVNLETMGHVLPISVYVKLLGTGSQARTWHPSTGGSVLGWLVVLTPLVVSLAVGVGAGVARWRARGATMAEGRDAVTGTVVLLNAGAVLYYAYLALGVRLVFRWYFALPLAVLVVTVVAGARVWAMRRGSVSRGRGWLSAVVVTVSVASSASTLWWVGNRQGSTSFHLREIARRVTDAVRPGGVVAVADAGAIGFFADRRVVNVDGLASDYEFVEEFLRKGRLLEYFAREGVTHYLVRDTHLTNRDAVLAGRGDAGRVIFDRRIALPPDRELFRYEIPGQFTVILFRLD